MWSSPFLWIAGSAALLGSSVVAAQEFTGDLTTYTLSSPMSGNCNFMTAPTAATQNYAAINGAQWDATKSCGRCAQVSCSDSRCKDTTASQIVYILDQCPECKQGDLDVSPSVFKAVTGSDPGRYKITWQFVDCPVQGNLQYCLKSGSNPYYAAIQPANAAVPVKSMTINAKATTMVPSAYYYLLESNIDLKAVKVSVTSTSGETVTDTVSLTAGQCTVGTSQFSASGSAPSAPAMTPSTPSATPSATPAPAGTTKAPVAPTPPSTRPTSTTRRPDMPSPTAATSTPSSTTRSPPRTETTKTPSPSAAADAGGDDDEDGDGDGDEDEDTATTAPATATPAATTTAPATPTTATPAATSATPAATTKAPVTPSTPSATKKVSCRRLED